MVREAGHHFSGEALQYRKIREESRHSHAIASSISHQMNSSIFFRGNGRSGDLAHTAHNRLEIEDLGTSRIRQRRDFDPSVD